MTRAPRWTRDLAYPPRRPLLEPTWDVKARYYLSLGFTVCVVVVGLSLSPVVGPVVRWWQGRGR